MAMSVPYSTYAYGFASLPVAVVLGAAIYEVAKTCYWRWAYRRIPGPAPAWLGGNLAGIIKAGGIHQALLQWRMEYGTLFKVFIMGRVYIVTASPANARLVLAKAVERPWMTQPVVLLSIGSMRKFIAASVLTETGPRWRALRVAWQQALNSGLSSYMEPMQACATNLCEAIKKRVSSGYFDLSDMINRMTVDVIGTCAYGVQFDALEVSEDTQGSSGHRIGSPLTRACQAIGTSSLGTSWWGFAYAALPTLQPLLAVLSTLYPGVSLGIQRQGILDLAFYSEGLIRDWHQTNSTTQSKDGTKIDKRSFIARVLDAQSKLQESTKAGPSKDGSEQLEHMSDVILASQAVTIIMAGTETTYNSLSFCVYLISKHPRVEEKLVEEIKAFGWDKPIGPDDWPQFPYLDAVVTEALRVFTIAHTMMRKMAPGSTISVRAWSVDGL